VQFLAIAAALGRRHQDGFGAGERTERREVVRDAALIDAKYVAVKVMTLPGLALSLLTGVPLMIRRRLMPNRARWMAVKLALVALITMNALLYLSPIAESMSAAAQQGTRDGALPASFGDLADRETRHGGLNLLMILAVIGLSVSRPRLGGTEPTEGPAAPHSPHAAPI